MVWSKQHARAAIKTLSSPSSFSALLGWDCMSVKCSPWYLGCVFAPKSRDPSPERIPCEGGLPCWEPGEKVREAVKHWGERNRADSHALHVME